MLRPLAVWFLISTVSMDLCASVHAASLAPPPIDLEPLEFLLETAVGDEKVAGLTLLIMHRGQTVYHGAYGYADLETKIPFRTDTPVVIASISKPLLGTAIFRLAQAGQLDVSTPITTYLPEFEYLKLESGQPAIHAPSLRDLLSHTSGTRAEEADGGRPWLASWTPGKTLAEVVTRYASDFPLRAQPGTRYAYSGIGTDIAARVAEVASGQPRNKLLRIEVADPLSMTDTGYRDANHLPPNMPTRYSLGKNGTLDPTNPRPIPPPGTYSSSGGSIISTAPDLASWLLMFRNDGMHDGKPYLYRETIYAMLTPIPKSQNTACGFFARRISKGGRPLVIGHTGSSGTDCWIDFENDIVGILLTQSSGAHTKALRLKVESLVTGLFTGNLEP